MRGINRFILKRRTRVPVTVLLLSAALSLACFADTQSDIDHAIAAQKAANRKSICIPATMC